MAEQRAAVILAGGRARRLAGVDKPAQVVAGQSLLQRVLAVAREWGAAIPIVVGPHREGYDPVVWTCEDPPGSGPAAALAAAMPFVPDGALVALLAADLPWLTADSLRRLEHGAVAVDATGREQWLVGVHRVEHLRGSHPAGASVRSLLDRPGLGRVNLPDHELADCDTAEQLQAARELA